MDVHARCIAQFVVQLKGHLILLLLLAVGILALILLMLSLLVTLLALVLRLTLATLSSLQPLVPLYTLPLDQWIALMLILVLDVVVWARRGESILDYLLVLGPVFKGVILLWLLRVTLVLVAVSSVRFVVLRIVLHRIIILVSHIIVL